MWVLSNTEIHGKMSQILFVYFVMYEKDLDISCHISFMKLIPENVLMLTKALLTTLPYTFFIKLYYYMATHVPSYI